MTETTHPKALLVTPTAPSLSGNGLAMRAGMWASILARRFELDLLIAPLWARGEGEAVDPSSGATWRGELPFDPDTHARLIERISEPADRVAALARYPKPWSSRLATPTAAQKVADWARERDHVLVLIMRLYLAPVAALLLDQPPGVRARTILDLDEDDETTALRLAALARKTGDDLHARFQEGEAPKFRNLATAYLSRFDVVTIASALDRDRLAKIHPSARLGLMPNVVASAPRPPSRQVKPNGGELHILFVGNLDYFPNRHGVGWFIDKVLPLLRGLHVGEIRVNVVGGGSPLGAVKAPPGCRVNALGFQPDLGPFYRDADLAIAPIHAGGGTRLKILEAFAHGVPVVSTTLGCEGLDVTAEEHLRIADNPSAFAGACQGLNADAGMAAAMAARAARLVSEAFSLEANQARLARILEGDKG